MTPPRLTELECPGCHTRIWAIDCDARGVDGTMQPYDERDYRCAQCAHSGPGWMLLRQSPPEFLLQPHPLYPMTNAEMKFWVQILCEHFPDHPAIARIAPLRGFRMRLDRMWRRIVARD